MNELVKQMPAFLSKEDFIKASLTTTATENVSYMSETERLLLLDKVFDTYIPSFMSLEIYQKVYLSIYRSLSQKQTFASVQQRNINYRRMLGTVCKGVIGGGNVILISGVAGIGKTAAIYNAVALATKQTIIETNQPLQRVIPCLIIQTPFDCSTKALLLEILRKVDDILETNYYPRTIPTVDTLIGSVCNICINHIGLLIIDEIQNVVNHRAGISLVHCLTELINNSGISMVFVGTPECEVFFSSTDYLARRAIGLHYGPLDFNNDFHGLCSILWHQQPLLNYTRITTVEYEWLYEHTGGITANIVSLLHDAMELAILSGTEILNLQILNEVYLYRMSPLHQYIAPTIQVKNNIPKPYKIANKQNIISSTIATARAENMNVIDALATVINVTEVSI